MPKKRITSSLNGLDALQKVTQALDEISYQWLSDAHPELAQAIDLAVSNGKSPVDIRRHVMARTARLELALRCEQYARCVHYSMGGED